MTSPAHAASPTAHASTASLATSTEPRASRTAWIAAAHRAAHQRLEGGRVFRDPLSERILGPAADVPRVPPADDPLSVRMRLFIAARTRLAEEALHAAIEAGVRQLVVLGAGLDTYAYRGAWRERLARIIEVDHPATQAWKRQRVAEAGIAVPPHLSYAPVNFESQTLAEGLAATGFDARQPSFFTWLGVVPYLTPQAIWATLRTIAGLAAPAHVVFDYANAPAQMNGQAREAQSRYAQRVASLGEAWLSYFEPEDLHPQLRALGFSLIHDLGPREIAEHFFPERVATAPARGGHVLHAATPPR